MKAMTTVLLLAASVAAFGQDSLRNTYGRYFHVGVAVNRAQAEGVDVRGDTIVAREFNSISPENLLKWKAVHPKDGAYDFGPADAFVSFGEMHQMVVIGHTLIWHEAAPEWVFQDKDGEPLSRAALLGRMHDHISTVVGRYRGRIYGWDVVNEALNDDGSLRDTPWRKIIGDDYIEKAFEFAHEADPKAELYYNDYLLENPDKRKGAIKLITGLRAKGIRVDAVGLQGHYSLTWPSVEQLDQALSDFEAAGIKANITELDVDVLPKATKMAGSADVNMNVKQRDALNPFASRLPQSVERELTDRYASLFRLFRKHHTEITRVTFWGVTDADSWLNNWPVRGRTNYPLLFDRQGNRKPAYNAVMDVAHDKSAPK